jgi:threonine/homoserine/homoserine lactone efflux protein
MPFLFLAALKSWEVMHGGDKAQLFASVGWLGAALLFYVGQKQIHDARHEKITD